MVTRVPGYPGTPIPVSALPAAAQTLTGGQIMYGNPVTRVPVSVWDPGTRVGFRLNLLPTQFQILRPGCNSIIQRRAKEVPKDFLSKFRFTPNQTSKCLMGDSPIDQSDAKIYKSKQRFAE